MAPFVPVKKVEESEETYTHSDKFTPIKKTSDPQASWARIGAQILGGMVGGVVAAPGGITTPIGIGLGSSMGGQLFDRGQELAGEKAPDTMSDAFKTSAYDFTLDVISPIAVSKGVYAGKKMLGSLVNKPVKHLFRPADLSKYRKFGVKPSAATATQSKPLMVAENALSDYPFSAGVLQKNAQYNVAQLKFANEYLAKEYGPILTKEEVGTLLKKGAPSAIERLDRVYNKLFTRISTEVGTSPQKLANTKEILQTLISETKTGPDSNIVGLAQEILEKAKSNNGGLPFEALKKHRSKIGEMLKEPSLVSTRNVQSGDLKRLYAALTKDMEAATLTAGPKVNARWRAANKYFENSLNKKIPVLEEIVKKGYDEQVYNIVMNSTKQGGSKLRALRRQLTREEWDAVSGSILHKLGRATPGNQNATGEMFSMNTFISNWNKMAPEAKQALWSGTKRNKLYRELNDLASVVGDFKNVEAIANKSKTGSVLMFFSLFQVLGSVSGGAAAGASGALGGMAAATSMSIAPHYTAKLLTNPAFVRWLSQGVKISKTAPNSMSSHLGRLYVLKEKEGLEDEINALMKNMSYK